MLQQTPVARVLPKYLEFIKKYPTWENLARAHKRALLQLWLGLGYNNRVVRLQRLAQLVVRTHDGTLPRDEDSLLQLPGIGPYTLRAVKIFAWNEDTVCIDTNIRRILLHELDLDEKTKSRELEVIARLCLPLGRSREWHNALMDYGALVVTSKKSGIRPLSRQSSFSHSQRYYRGQILRRILTRKRESTTALVLFFKDSPYDIRDIIHKLVLDGIVREKGELLQI